MKKIARRFYETLALANSGKDCSQACLVGQPISFTDKPTVEIYYSMEGESHLWICGQVLASYDVSIFGAITIEVFKSEIFKMQYSGIELAEFFSMNIEGIPDPAKRHLMDYSPPWLYGVLGNQQIYRQAAPSEAVSELKLLIERGRQQKGASRISGAD
jgi:hypothetical protein